MTYYNAGDKVWVVPEAGSTKWRRGKILRVTKRPNDHEVQLSTDTYEDVCWFYAAELRPRSAIEQLGELV